MGMKREISDRWMTGGAKLIRAAAMVQRGSRLIVPSDWRLVSQATPSTIFPSKPTSLTAYSDAANSYDSTTLGKKFIFKYSRAINVPEDEQYYVLSDFAFPSSIEGAFYNEAEASVTVSAAGIYDVLAQVRLRAITEDFDSTILCWDNVVSAPILSYSSEIDSVRLAGIWDQNGPAAMTHRARSQSRDMFVLPGPLSLYGFIVDVQPVLGNLANVTACYAEYFPLTLDSEFGMPVLIP